MKGYISKLLTLFLLSTVFFAPKFASAQDGNKIRNAKVIVREIQRAQKRLARIIGNFQYPQSALQVNSPFISSLSDSDGDGLIDLLENPTGYNICSQDTDSDSEGDVEEIGYNRVLGLIEDIDVDNLSIAKKYFYINSDDASFEDSEGGPLTINDFTAGDCAEAYGYQINVGIGQYALKLDKLIKKSAIDCTN